MEIYWNIDLYQSVISCLIVVIAIMAVFGIVYFWSEFKIVRRNFRRGDDGQWYEEVD